MDNIQKLINYQNYLDKQLQDCILGGAKAMTKKEWRVARFIKRIYRKIFKRKYGKPICEQYYKDWYFQKIFDSFCEKCMPKNGG